MHENHFYGTKKMTQWLEHALHFRRPRFLPCTHLRRYTVACNSSSRASDALSALQGHRIHVYKPNRHIHIIKSRSLKAF